MATQLLNFIFNEDLFAHTRRLVQAALSAEESCEADPYRNVIDPFSALVDASRQKISLDDWLLQEKARQIQKAFQNEVGNFHQNILGSIPGWTNMGLTGGSYDLKNVEKKIIAEVKNKYNTLSGGGLIALYHTLESHLDYGLRNQGYTAYHVVIVPKTPRPMNQPFTPSENSRPARSREDLRKIDGRSFYELATGDPDALKKLYHILPTVLAEIIDTSRDNIICSESFNELFDRAYTE